MGSQIKADYWYGALSIVASEDVLVGLLLVVLVSLGSPASKVSFPFVALM
jgi:hypothetical protein